MPGTDHLNDIHFFVDVPVERERAFDRFVTDFPHWYPPAYTWSGERLERIELGTTVGAMCRERGPDGFTLDWGIVTAFDRPVRIAFTWQIGADRVPVPDRNLAGAVEVTFSPSADGATRVSLAHRGFDRYRGDAAAYRAAMASDQGWPLILQCYRAICQAPSPV